MSFIETVNSKNEVVFQSVPVLSGFVLSSGVLMTPLIAAWATAFCFFSSSMVFLSSFSSKSYREQDSGFRPVYLQQTNWEWETHLLLRRQSQALQSDRHVSQTLLERRHQMSLMRQQPSKNSDFTTGQRHLLTFPGPNKIDTPYTCWSKWNPIHLCDDVSENYWSSFICKIKIKYCWKAVLVHGGGRKPQWVYFKSSSAQIETLYISHINNNKNNI